jgi:hypothetical protein
MNRETLAQYVSRIMHQKNLKPGEVRENCGKQLSGSYIARVAKGTMTNLTIESMLALAEGLQVSPYELLAAASGVPPETEPSVDPMLLVDTMQKLVMHPKLIMVVQELADLTPEQQEGILKSLKLLNNKRKGKSGKKD